MLKVHILYRFRDGPFGGGNQFLRALRDVWQRQDCYVEVPECADIILINSLDNYHRLLMLRLLNKKAIFIHRVDGLFQYHRPIGGVLEDRLTHVINRYFANATIFQSCWSRRKHHQLGCTSKSHEVVFHNVADPKFFYPKKPSLLRSRVRLIAVSWSSNLKKGYHLYDYLDKHMDWSHFEMTFIGNSPLEFKHIRSLKPMPSKQLGDELRNHDVYISCSKDDACSNSLLEAIACGLPVAAVRSGGNPELVRGHGLLFEGELDVIETIERLIAEYTYFKTTSSKLGIEEVAERYIEFFKQIETNSWSAYTSLVRILYAVCLMSVLKVRLAFLRRMSVHWSMLKR